ncbi:CPBP family intramembrane metalloprotease [Caballeronia sp. LZ062]|uniref:CPBP family intramembrane glutamic endopeptidase n=1 Tax=unclassified Caballeronia TaxID=2646786 RepID=UPI002861B8D8|nr:MULTISPECIES: CPBP family intramembrane glutamic endopeptidase [unclassified Caballeronia]MDR5857689.1 CPBP family intramembrane metalloprotease [Caballeronia sp. LZ050]MDR5869239.1 CPBP family intramembrane metalloprotease [Caballeronia sp. LZ062]
MHRQHSETQHPARHLALWVEFGVLYAGVPLFILATRQTAILLAVIWLAPVLIHYFERQRRPSLYANDWDWRGLRAGAPAVVVRFAILASLIALAVRYFMPHEFMSLPRQHPVTWVLVLLLYPILSVWPQELIFRSFLLHRYRAILGDKRGYIAASALAFGYAHVIFLNWLAPAMTAVGGALFAATYRHHRSLALSCFEHALYGCLVFTVGLGQYFYSGAAWSQ